MENENRDGVRLQVRLARAGVASRRKCEEYIAEGRVSVNGRVVIAPGTKVTDGDEVRLDGNLVREEKRKVYIALHKPSGFLCSDEDPDGRPLAKSLLDVVVKERIFHVGRLDYMTSGLIFYTNDGEFARALTHPSRRIEKEYVVTTKNAIPEELMERFLKGLTVEGVRYKASSAVLTGPRTARIVLTEGKNRGLRRVFLSASVSIKKVHRVRIGKISVKGIESGHFRYLKDHEVRELMEGRTPAPTPGPRRGGSRRDTTGSGPSGGSRPGRTKTGNTRSGGTRTGDSRSGGGRNSSSGPGGTRTGDSRSDGVRNRSSKPGGSKSGGARPGGSGTGRPGSGGTKTGNTRSGGAGNSSPGTGDSRSGGVRNGSSRTGTPRPGRKPAGKHKGGR